MASVNRPLSRRFSPKLNYLELSSKVVIDVPATIINVAEPTVYVNQPNSALLTIGAGKVHSTVTETPANSAELTISAGYVNAYTGPQARITIPAGYVTSTGTVQNIARAYLTIGPGVVSASGYVGGVASASLTLTGRLDVTAYTGAQASLSLAPFGYSVTSNVIVGGFAEARLALDPFGYVVTSSVTAHTYGSAYLVGQALQSVPSSSAYLVGPALTAYAVASVVVAVTYEAYAINLSTGAVTHYTNFPFDNVVRFGNAYYGVAPTGVFLIDGSLDLTADIDAHIKTFSSKLGTKGMKRVPYVYTSGRSDGGVTVGVTADEGTTYSYDSDWGEVAGSTNHRTVPGKGIRGVYYSFDVSNINGSSLELDGLEAVTAASPRSL